MESVFNYSKVDTKKSTKLKEGMVVTSEKLPEGKWLLVYVNEQQPRTGEYGRMTSYENTFKAISINDDFSYEEDQEPIQFSTAHVFRGSIPEEEITVVKQLVKSYVVAD